MAAKKIVEIILKTKDDTKKGNDSAKKGLDETKKSADNLNSSNQKLNTSTKALSLSTVAVAAAVTALAVAYDAAIDSAGVYQESILEIATLTGATAQQSKELSKDLNELSVEFGQVNNVMAKANYNVVSAGFGDVADSLIIMEVSSRAAIAGLTDVNTAAKVITQTLNAYGKGAGDAEKIAGDLFATIKGGVTTFEELAAGLGQVTGIAAAADIPFEELSAAMALVTKNGSNTAMGATSLAALITALGAATGESKQQLDEMGINLENGLLPALEALGVATDGDLDKLAALIPNIRAIRAAAALASDGGEQFAEQLDAMGDGVDDFNKAYKIMSDSYQNSVRKNEAASKRFKEAIGATGLEGKQVFLDQWTEGLDFLAEIVEENSTQLKGFADNVFYVAGALAKATAGAVAFVFWAGEKLAGALEWVAGVSGEASIGVADLNERLKSATEQMNKFNTAANQAGPMPFIVDAGTQASIDAELERQDELKRVRAEAAAAAEKTAKDEAQALGEAIAEQVAFYDIDPYKTIFSIKSGTYEQIAKTGEELGNELTTKINEVLGQKILDPPKIPKDLLAVPDDGAGGKTQELQLYEDILEADKLLQEQLGLSSEEEHENQLITLDLLARNQEEIDAVIAGNEKRIQQARDLAFAMGRVGGATVRAFLEGENSAKAFGNAIKNEIIAAIEEAIAKAIVLAAFNFFSGGILDIFGGFEQGGQVPGGKSAGVSKAAFGYSVPDGVRGKDSKLIMAQPGEEVIDRGLSRRLNRFISAAESSAYISPWNLQGSGGSGGTIVMNVGIPQSQAGLVTMQKSVTQLLDERESGAL